MPVLRIFLLMLLIPLSTKATETSAVEILTANGIDTNSAQIIKRNVLTVEQLKTFDDDYNELNTKGIFAKVAKSKGAEMVAMLRTQLGDGLRVYLQENNYGYKEDVIAIGHFANDLEYLRVAKPSGVNWDVQPNDVINKYKVWHEKYKLKLVGAGLDWLEAEIDSDNVDWQQLAAEVYQFCPDVVEQGSGDVALLATEMKSTKVLFLWWD